MTQKVPPKMPLQSDITNQTNNISVRSNKVSAALANGVDHSSGASSHQQKLKVGK